MSFIEYLKIVSEILQNWYVLGTVIAMLLMIAFAEFIVKYRRKPKKSKKKKIVEVSSAPIPAPEAMEEGAVEYEE